MQDEYEDVQYYDEHQTTIIHYDNQDYTAYIKVKIRLPKLLQISGYTLYQFR